VSPRQRRETLKRLRIRCWLNSTPDKESDEEIAAISLYELRAQVGLVVEAKLMAGETF
jgi:hypothetical protein